VKRLRTWLLTAVVIVVLTPTLVAIGILLGTALGLGFGIGGPIMFAIGKFGTETTLGQFADALSAAERLARQDPRSN